MLYFLTLCVMLFSQIAANLPLTFSLPESYVIHEKEHDGGAAIIIAHEDVDFSKLEAESDLTTPVILGIKMQFTNSFDTDIVQMLTELKKQFPHGFEANQLKWGNYPLIAIKLRMGEDDCYLAYVSFEDAAKNGIMFTFGYPRKLEFGNGNKPSSKDLAFWNDFLSKTNGVQS